MDTHLDKIALDVTFTSIYRRTDKAANQLDIRDALRYINLKKSFVHGNGDNRANLIYYTRSTLVNAIEYWDLDGVLQDVFGNFINYDSVKALIIHNTELITTDNASLRVHFKTERYNIGPQGFRVLWEPKGQGVMSEASSGSQEEGKIQVESNASVTYDIIIVGSSMESSSSSG